MPNWSSNTMTTNNPALIEIIKEVAENKGELLGAIVPLPKALKGIHQGGYFLPDGTSVKQWRTPYPGVNVPITEEEIAAMIAEHGTSSWYDWSVDHWGTKWDADIDRISFRDDGSVQIWFDTAWAPPTKWLETVVEKYPQGRTTMAYAEGGMGFYGEIVWVDGQVKDKFEDGHFWADDIDWEKVDDPMDGLTPCCAAHLESHSLGTGG